MKDQNIFKINGMLGVAIVVVLFFGVGYSLYNTFDTKILADWTDLIIPGILFTVGLILATGFVVVEPNQAKVCIFLGKYAGTIRDAGFWLTIPLCTKQNISQRVMNFNSEKLKVNDLDGNPIEIAAVIVYKVTKPAMAAFDVENYQEFVHVQSESGIRHVASQYPYDNLNNPDSISLRQHSDEVCEILKEDLHRRFEIAGVEIIEARIMHLAYSNEIAAAMLQRQQASAVLSAREIIVLGAVSMVKDAITQLSEEKIVDLDNDKKAQMVNNLLVAIVSEKGTQPVMNNNNIS